MLVGGVISALEGQQAQNPPNLQNLPSGYGMQPCACLNFNPAPFAQESRCASGQVRANVCAAVCPTGQPQVAYVCR